MAARVFRHGDAYYLTGAGATPCLRWHRQDDQWLSQPHELPAASEAVSVQDLPEDLREELLAFATRADVMGAAAAQLGN